MERTGNRIKLLWDTPPHKFEIVLQETSPGRGTTTNFAIVEPRGFPNYRIKISPNAPDTHLEAIGKAIVHLSQKPQRDKWTQEFLRSEPRLVEEYRVSESGDRAEPEMSEIARFHYSGDWLRQNATPPEPREYWVWFNQHWNIDGDMYEKSKECQEYTEKVREEIKWLQQEKGWKS